MGSRFSLRIILITVAFFLFIAWEQEGLAKAHYTSALRLRVFKEKVEAPDFALPDLNGRKVRLKDLRGNGVFVNFWATWCPPCRREMPSRENLQLLFPDPAAGSCSRPIVSCALGSAAQVRSGSLSFSFLISGC